MGSPPNPTWCRIRVDIGIRTPGPGEAEDGDEQWYNSVMDYRRWPQACTPIATEAGPDLTHDRLREIVPFADLVDARP